MTRRALKSIRNAVKSADKLLVQVMHSSPRDRDPDPAKRAAEEAAKTIRDAMHVTSAGGDAGGAGGGTGGFSGTSVTDKMFGQVLADGHKRARDEAAPPGAG